MKVAALDLGSNSFHLLVARVSPRGALDKIVSHKMTVRLASGMVDGRLADEAFERGLAALGEMAAVMRAHADARLVAVGTSALREAGNGQAFVAEARRRHGIHVEILGGGEEARMAYDGARSGLPALPPRAVVVDLGGGSAEIAAGEGARVALAATLPLGFLRLAKRLSPGGEIVAPLGDDEEATLHGYVLASCASIASQLAAFAPEAWVFTGGTARQLGRLLGPGAIDASAVARAAARLARRDPASLVALGVDPARAPMMGIGATIIASLVAGLGAPAIQIGACGLREGLVLREGRRSVREAEPDAADRDDNVLRAFQLAPQT